MNIDLKKYGRTINVGEKFKSTVTVLKRADPNLLVLPIKVQQLILSFIE